MILEAGFARADVDRSICGPTCQWESPHGRRCVINFFKFLAERMDPGSVFDIVACFAFRTEVLSKRLHQMPLLLSKYLSFSLTPKETRIWRRVNCSSVFRLTPRIGGRQKMVNISTVRYVTSTWVTLVLQRTSAI